MAYSISTVDVWVGTIEDRPGGLSEKLKPLAEAGANLEFLIGRKAPDKPHTGVVFVAPIKGAKQVNAAKKADLRVSKSLRSLRVEGPDRSGLCSAITLALGEAGINLRGISAAALGKRSVVYIAFDNPADTGKAGRILKKTLGRR
ncbi:MAG: amino acid-binding protein [Candidatus Omnitrophica bacterium]|nr:amino acid-binding protein [Candidatus Omnitrophota bacterium]